MVHFFSLAIFFNFFFLVDAGRVTVLGLHHRHLYFYIVIVFLYSDTPALFAGGVGRRKQWFADVGGLLTWWFSCTPSL